MNLQQLRINFCTFVKVMKINPGHELSIVYNKVEELENYCIENYCTKDVISVQFTLHLFLIRIRKR